MFKFVYIFTVFPDYFDYQSNKVGVFGLILLILKKYPFVTRKHIINLKRACSELLSVLSNFDKKLLLRFLFSQDKMSMLRSGRILLPVLWRKTIKQSVISNVHTRKQICPLEKTLNTVRFISSTNM